MRVAVGIAEKCREVLRMSQALRIDPTMIETYSAMLVIDRSELSGADTPNNAFVPLEAGGQAVPTSETIGADDSDRFNADGHPMRGVEFIDARQEVWWKKVHEVCELTVVSCRNTNTLARSLHEGKIALSADEAKIVQMPLVVRVYGNGVGTSATGQS